MSGKTPKKYLFERNVKKNFHLQHLYPPGREIRNKLIFNLGLTVSTHKSNLGMLITIFIQTIRSIITFCSIMQIHFPTGDVAIYITSPATRIHNIHVDVRFKEHTKLDKPTRVGSTALTPATVCLSLIQRHRRQRRPTMNRDQGYQLPPHLRQDHSDAV